MKNETILGIVRGFVIIGLIVFCIYLIRWMVLDLKETREYRSHLQCPAGFEYAAGISSNLPYEKGLCRSGDIYKQIIYVD